MSSPFYSPYAGKLFKEISHVLEFERDLKKLLKRFTSLEEDLRIFIKVAMNAFHKQNLDNGAIVHISDLRIHSPEVFKGRKFACKSLKGKGVQSGIRVIYAYHEKEDSIEFIEIYFKGDKESEDRERILKYFKKKAEPEAKPAKLPSPSP